MKQFETFNGFLEIKAKQLGCIISANDAQQGSSKQFPATVIF
jgi:hypothetical protein